MENKLYLELRIHRYNPLRAGSHLTLPEKIEKKKAIINIKNDDDMCFKWAVLSALYPAPDNAGRVSHYKSYENSLNFTGITFPMKISDIDKFEAMNSLSINVFCLNREQQTCPFRISMRKHPRIIDLLYLKDGDHSHYAWIKDMSRLIGSQLSRRKNKKYICRRCLSTFGSQDLLEKHDILCSDHESILVKMPTDETKMIEFRNIKSMQEIPFVIVADFEAVTKKISSCEPSSNSSYGMPYQKHEAACFCYYILYSHGLYKPPVIYRGKDAAAKMMEMLSAEAKEIEKIYKKLSQWKPYRFLKKKITRLQKLATCATTDSRRKTGKFLNTTI